MEDTQTPEVDPQFKKDTYLNLKDAFGDDYPLTEDEFNSRFDSDENFVNDTYKNLKDAYGDDYTLTEADFKKKVGTISPTGPEWAPGSEKTPSTSGSEGSPSRSRPYEFKLPENTKKKAVEDVLKARGYDQDKIDEFLAPQPKPVEKGIPKLAQPDTFTTQRDQTAAAPFVPELQKGYTREELLNQDKAFKEAYDVVKNDAVKPREVKQMLTTDEQDNQELDFDKVEEIVQKKGDEYKLSPYEKTNLRNAIIQTYKSEPAVRKARIAADMEYKSKFGVTPWQQSEILQKEVDAKVQKKLDQVKQSAETEIVAKKQEAEQEATVNMEAFSSAAEQVYKKYNDLVQSGQMKPEEAQAAMTKDHGLLIKDLQDKTKKIQSRYMQEQAAANIKAQQTYDDWIKTTHLHSGMTPEQQAEYSKMFNKQFASAEKQRNLDMENTFRQKGLLQKVNETLTAGSGDLLVSAGGMLGMAGFANANYAINKAVEKQAFKDNQVAITPESATDLDWWIANGARTLPMMAVLAPIGMGAGAGSSAIARMHTSSARFKGLIASVGGGLASWKAETLMEQGSGFNQAIAEGKTPEQAAQVAKDIGEIDMATIPLQMMEIAPFFNKMPAILSVAMGTISGGTEELIQGYATNKALANVNGLQYTYRDYLKDPEAGPTFVLGAAMSAPFVIGGKLAEIKHENKVKALLGIIQNLITQGSHAKASGVIEAAFNNDLIDQQTKDDLDGLLLKSIEAAKQTASVPDAVLRASADQALVEAMNYKEQSDATPEGPMKDALSALFEAKNTEAQTIISGVEPIYQVKRKGDEAPTVMSEDMMNEFLSDPKMIEAIASGDYDVTIRNNPKMEKQAAEAVSKHKEEVAKLAEEKKQKNKKEIANAPIEGVGAETIDQLKTGELITYKGEEGSFYRDPDTNENIFVNSDGKESIISGGGDVSPLSDAGVESRVKGKTTFEGKDYFVVQREGELKVFTKSDKGILVESPLGKSKKAEIIKQAQPQEITPTAEGQTKEGIKSTTDGKDATLLEDEKPGITKEEAVSRIFNIPNEKQNPTPQDQSGDQKTGPEKTEREPTEKEKQINKELDDLAAEMRKLMGLNIGVNPEALAVAIKFVAKHVELGIYKLADIVTNAKKFFGDKLSDFIDSIKAAYMAYMPQANGSPEPTPVSKNQALQGEFDSAKNDLKDAWDQFKNTNKGNLGVVSFDPEKEAQALYDLHEKMVNLATAAIRLGVSSIEDWAKKVGVQVTRKMQLAWDDAQDRIAGYPPIVADKDYFKNDDEFQKVLDKQNKDYEDKQKSFYEKLKLMFTRGMLDTRWNLRQFLENNHSPEVFAYKNLVAGASQAAEHFLNEKIGKIYKGLNSKTEVILDGIIQARRNIALDDFYDEKRDTEKNNLIADYVAKNGANPTGADLKAIEDIAQENNRRALHSGDTNREEAAIHLAKIEASDPKLYEKLMDRADQFFDAMRELLKFRLDEGRIDKATYDNMVRMDYAKRIFLERLFDGLTSPNKSYSSLNPAGIEDIHKMDGGSVQMQFNRSRFLLMNSASTAYRAVFENNANRELYNFAKSLPTNGIVQTQDPIGPGKFPPAPHGWTQIKYYEKGEIKSMVMQNEMAQEWMQMDPNIKSAAANVIRTALSGYLREFATGVFNPVFFLTNFPRDIVFVTLFTNTYSPFIPIAAAKMTKDMLASAWDVFTRGKLVKNSEFLKATQEGMMMNFLTHQGSAVLTGKFTQNKLERAWDTVHEFMGYISLSLEMLPRMAIRTREIKKATRAAEKKLGRPLDPITDKELIKRISRLASNAGRDYLDFAQGGSVNKTIDIGVPYFNAANLAFRNAVKYSVNNKGASAVKIAQYMAFTAALAAYLLSKYKDDYDDGISTDEKARYHIILLPFTKEDPVTGKITRAYLKVSKEQQAAPAAAISEELVNYGMNGKFDMDKIWTAMDYATPNLSSAPMVAAWSAVYANYDTYTKQKIWKGEEWAENWSKYDPNDTQQLFVQVGKVWDKSPAQVKRGASKLFTDVDKNFFTSGFLSLWDKTTEFMNPDEKRDLNDAATNGFEKALGAPLKKILDYTKPGINDKTIERAMDVVKHQGTQRIIESNKRKQLVKDIMEKKDVGALAFTNKEKAKYRKIIQRENIGFEGSIVLRMGVENMERAKYLVWRTGEMKTEQEKVDYLNLMKENKVISKTVVAQMRWIWTQQGIIRTSQQNETQGVDNKSSNMPVIK